VLPAGDYKVTASSDNPEPAAFENPYYFGETAFTLENGDIKTVTITCALANCKVSIAYTQNVTNNFSDYSTVVSHEEDALTFEKDETRAGYFTLLPLTIKATLTYTDPGGEKVTQSLTGSIPDPQPKTHYKVTIDAEVKFGKVSLIIEVDEDLDDVDVLIGEDVINLLLNKTFGGSGQEVAWDIIQTIDGNYVLTGTSFSSDGDFSGGNGGQDLLVMKVNDEGELLWQKAYGGSNHDFGQFIMETSSSNLLVLGLTLSDDGDVGDFEGGESDLWALKLNSSGDLLWESTYGRGYRGVGTGAVELADGSFIIVGQIQQPENTEFIQDAHIIKVSNSGDLLWEKIYGEQGDDGVGSIITLENGEFLVGGAFETSSSGKDVWIIKLDESGDIIWDKKYGGSKDDIAASLIPTADGNFVAVGNSASRDRDVSNNEGLADMWILKINEDGDLLWESTYGKTLHEIATSVIESDDKGYIVAGVTNSNNGKDDGLIVKFNVQGQLRWESTIGGSEFDQLLSITRGTNGGYMVAGGTDSKDGDIPATKGDFDVWVFKFLPQSM